MARWSDLLMIRSSSVARYPPHGTQNQAVHTLVSWSVLTWLKRNSHRVIGVPIAYRDVEVCRFLD